MRDIKILDIDKDFKDLKNRNTPRDIMKVKEYTSKLGDPREPGSGKPSELMRLLARIEACFPENPYPKSVFPMTEDEYVKEIPDPHTRTAISGFMGRFVFEATKRRFLEAIKDEFEC